MIRSQELDLLMDAYCKGLYAMDPRTTYPFWDYDFAPLYSDLWIAKMIAATRHPACQNLNREQCLRLFSGPSVPRKELIYSLVDMKVAGCLIDERMRLVEYWLAVLKSLCGDDWLSNGSNRAVTDDKIQTLLADDGWSRGNRTNGRALGALTSALNALAYGLYSDVFVHQCAECQGPYDVSPSNGGPKRTLMLRSWSGLHPTALWPLMAPPPFTRLTIAAIYEDVEFEVDVYNHVSWKGNLPEHLLQYHISIDGETKAIETDEIARIADEVARLADGQHRSYRALGFEAHKALWIRQRNFQFRTLFSQAQLSLEAPEMELAVRGKPLLTDPFWDMTLPRKELFRFFKRCLDPREDYPYSKWGSLFRETMGYKLLS